MPIFDYISTKHAEVSELKQTFYTEELGILPCPYFYDASNNNSKNTLYKFGLFKPFNTSSINEAFEDVAYQALVNPFATFTGSLMCASFSLVSVFENLALSFLATTGLMNKPIIVDGESDNYLEQGLLCLFLMAPYFALHAILDPLWELMAFVTRSGATLFSGAASLCTEENCETLEQAATTVSEFCSDVIVEPFWELMARMNRSSSAPVTSVVHDSKENDFRPVL